MGPKEQAEYLFFCIGWGRENAVTRPEDGDIDRNLRALVEKHNSDIKKPGVIINVGNGYYKPRNWVLVEMLEYKEYRNKYNSREKKLHDKGKAMDCKFYRSELMNEIPYETYEQLSLPV